METDIMLHWTIYLNITVGIGTIKCSILIIRRISNSKAVNERLGMCDWKCNIHCLNQAWATPCPRAGSGPRDHFAQPAGAGPGLIYMEDMSELCRLEVRFRCISNLFLVLFNAKYNFENHLNLKEPPCKYNCIFCDEDQGALFPSQL
jgi:hypothetical protein